MKKIIVTLCSLALSIAATFGTNQLQPKDEAVIDKSKDQITLEQEAEVVEEASNLPEDDIYIEETLVEDDKASELEEATPKTDNTNKKDTEDKNDNNTENKTEDKKAPVTNNYNKKASNKNTKKENKDNNIKPVKNTNNTGKQDSISNTKDNNTKKDTNNDANCNLNKNTNNAQKNINDYLNDFKLDGKNVYVYKGVDLSNCDSTEDVVEELQKNGYKNINTSNIQNISSLEDILSLIGDKGSQVTPKQPTSTKAPATPIQEPTAPKQEPTTPKQPTPTSSPTNPSNNSYADEVLRLVNIERNKAGLSNLTTTSSLTAAANKRAQETKTSFSHTRPNGTKFSTVLQEYGVSYRTAGENIAYGQRSPQEVVTGWMNSPGHRANILNGSFKKIGIGVYQSGGVIYWSQLFTN